jgi:general L-amino acid transport system substrate-binding protein
MFPWLILYRKSNFLLFTLILAIASGCTNLNHKTQTSSHPNQIEASSNNRLNIIKQRGKLICGVNDQIPGFSYKEKDGSYSGLSVDFCRAIAVALFDDVNKIEFRHLDSKESFAAVKSGEVDLLSRNTTWNLSRDTSQGLDFPPTNFYDGQGLLVGQNNEIERIEDLNGKSICVLTNTTSENNLTIQMRKKNLAYTPITFEAPEPMYNYYESGSCDAVTSDRSELTARRVGLAKPEAHKLLPEIISKEPLGPVIADDEPEWFDVVEWVSYATIKAEEMGINSQNVDHFDQTKNPAIRRFLGRSVDLGKQIGLPHDFARKIIQQVGNYGEIYDRNIGKPFNLERGYNNLVNKGGLIHSPPFR